MFRKRNVHCSVLAQIFGVLMIIGKNQVRCLKKVSVNSRAGNFKRVLWSIAKLALLLMMLVAIVWTFLITHVQLGSALYQMGIGNNMVEYHWSWYLFRFDQSAAKYFTEDVQIIFVFSGVLFFLADLIIFIIFFSQLEKYSNKRRIHLVNKANVAVRQVRNNRMIDVVPAITTLQQVNLLEVPAIIHAFKPQYKLPDVQEGHTRFFFIYVTIAFPYAGPTVDRLIHYVDLKGTSAPSMFGAPAYERIDSKVKSVPDQLVFMGMVYTINPISREAPDTLCWFLKQTTT